MQHREPPGQENGFWAGWWKTRVRTFLKEAPLVAGFVFRATECKITRSKTRFALCIHLHTEMKGRQENQITFTALGENTGINVFLGSIQCFYQNKTHKSSQILLTGPLNECKAAPAAGCGPSDCHILKDAQFVLCTGPKRRVWGGTWGGSSSRHHWLIEGLQPNHCCWVPSGKWDRRTQSSHFVGNTHLNSWSKVNSPNCLSVCIPSTMR